MSEQLTPDEDMRIEMALDQCGGVLINTPPIQIPQGDLDLLLEFAAIGGNAAMMKANAKEFGASSSLTERAIEITKRSIDQAINGKPYMNFAMKCMLVQDAITRTTEAIDKQMPKVGAPMRDL